MLKRSFDIVGSLVGIVVLLPFLLFISMLILINSGFPVFYRQTRVGLHNKDFKLFKFRSMRKDSDRKGLLTVGGRDARITGIGYYLRKYKLDELPQLLNVLLGHMSFVGPRPEVRKYVDFYSTDQQKVLSVKPGITDFASIEFMNENDLLAGSPEPEETYIREIMPRKLELNLKYIESRNFLLDIKIILQTLLKIVK